MTDAGKSLEIRSDQPGEGEIEQYRVMVASNIPGNQLLFLLDKSRRYIFYRKAPDFGGKKKNWAQAENPFEGKLINEITIH